MTCLRVTLALASVLLAAPLAAQQSGSAAKLDPQTALRDSQAAIGRDMSRHQLLDARGNPVRLGDFNGKPLLVSFIYTGCFQVCPTTTRSLSEAVDQLAEVFGEGTFNVVSIGFNQPFDSPAAMRAFAAQMRIDKPNWKFLSPPPATVDALTTDFGFRYVATPAGFDHMLTVSVLDAQGRIATQVYGERLTRDQLGEPLRLMLRDAPMPVGMPLTELIERVRILCTVYDPETGSYRYNYALFIEIAGGITFALAMAWFFLAEWRDLRRRQRIARRAAQAQALNATAG
ncbi:MAG: SCO family protein [Rhodoferax sp.]|mgnify:FL=1|nr:SCO family protein [Rhodoferax sp.]MBP9931677.1 SCO family protein [Rhodoferax sp.]HQX59425.1 SCO family protein [Burkholderiaceae bacterium]HRA62005.1 SCO family protein [Burkholderiaceae bacterium]